MQHPISVEGFVSWAARQPADSKYEYGDIYNCALCQYFRSFGLPIIAVAPYGWYDGANLHPYPVEMDNITRGIWNDSKDCEFQNNDQTFAGIVARAKELV